MTGPEKRMTRFEYHVAHAFEQFGCSWGRSGSFLGVDLKVLEDGELRFLCSCKKTPAKNVVYLPKTEFRDFRRRGGAPGSPGQRWPGDGYAEEAEGKEGFQEG